MAVTTNVPRARGQSDTTVAEQSKRSWNQWKYPASTSNTAATEPWFTATRKNTNRAALIYRVRARNLFATSCLRTRTCALTSTASTVTPQRGSLTESISELRLTWPRDSSFYAKRSKVWCLFSNAAWKPSDTRSGLVVYRRRRRRLNSVTTFLPEMKMIFWSYDRSWSRLGAYATIVRQMGSYLFRSVFWEWLCLKTSHSISASPNQIGICTVMIPERWLDGLLAWCTYVNYYWKKKMSQC